MDDEGLAHVTFDDPNRSANILTEPVMRRLGEIVRELRRDAESGRVRGVLFSSAKTHSFIVGADIEAIAQVESPDEGAEGSRTGQVVYLGIERLPVPTIAAIHGTCLGGGLELALACRIRIASDHPDTSLAFPEVLLGILPAWGGTSRLPRLIGLPAALDLLLSGRSLSARSAKRLGLVDEMRSAGGFLESAKDLLRAVVRGASLPTPSPRPFSARLLEGSALGRWILFRAAGRRIEKETGGHYPAPRRILEVVKSSRGRSLEAALDLEATAAGELIASSVSTHLVHVFQLRERARRGSHVPGLAEARGVTALGVVGAGVMGGGIAQLAAYHGARVRLRDVRHEAVAQALRYARSLFDKAVNRRKLEKREAAQGMERISGGVDGAGFGAADLVIEAVVEKLEVKRGVFRELEGRVSKQCVLATNTSSLSVDAIAASLKHPERLLGMHFFNPVHKMPLVEVVRGRATSNEAVAVTYAFALRLGKVPIVVRDGPGFLVNRILGPYLNEAGFLLQEGASIAAVDGVARQFGMPMGPLRLIDEIGIDIMGHAGEALHVALGDRMAPSPPLVALGASGRLGRKGGVGVYLYEDDREKGVEPGAYEAMNLGSPSQGGGPSREEIRDRLVLTMINEAARILADEVATAAADVDLAMIMGTGFPPFRGGLLRLGDERHPRWVAERLATFERDGASRFAPAPLLLQLAREDRGFYDAFPARG